MVSLGKAPSRFARRSRSTVRSWSRTTNPERCWNLQRMRQGYACPPVVMGATMTVRKWALSSSGETMTHGRVFWISLPSVPVGARTVLARVCVILDDPTRALPATLHQTLTLLIEEVRALETRVAAVDRELARVARIHPAAARLPQVPGAGVVTATAMVGAVSHIHAFRRGRDFASWLGLTPRESTTGNRRYLGRISKRGDGYLRCLLTHGARAVLLAAQRTARTAPQRLTRLQQWAVTLAARRGHNKAAIGLANKLARIIWALWCREADFHSPLVTPVAV